LLLVSCSSAGGTRSGDGDPNPQIRADSPLSILRTIPELSEFAAAYLSVYGTGEPGSGSGYTILAPVNAAIRDDTPADADIAARCHVLDERLDAGLLTTRSPGRTTTIAGTTITFRLADGAVVFAVAASSARLLGADFESRNGVIHLVDALLPC
jgi:hypothetical protein